MPRCAQVSCGADETDRRTTGQQTDNAGPSESGRSRATASGGAVISKNIQGRESDRLSPPIEQKTTPIPAAAKTMQQRSVPVSGGVSANVSGTANSRPPAVSQLQRGATSKAPQTVNLFLFQKSMNFLSKYCRCVGCLPIMFDSLLSIILPRHF